MDEWPSSTRRTAARRPRAPHPSDLTVRWRRARSLPRRADDETTRLRFFILHPHLARTRSSASPTSTITTVKRSWRSTAPTSSGSAASTACRARTTQRSRSSSPTVGKAMESAPTCSNSSRIEQTEGVTRFVAETLGENHRMRGVFRDSGLLVESETEAGVVHVVLDLPLEPCTAPRQGLIPWKSTATDSKSSTATIVCVSWPRRRSVASGSRQARCRRCCPSAFTSTASASWCAPVGAASSMPRCRTLSSPSRSTTSIRSITRVGASP